jgi:hypothetical protein
MASDNTNAARMVIVPTITPETKAFLIMNHSPIILKIAPPRELSEKKPPV